jgi:two-component system, NtrC family, response regulator PilR
MMTELPNNPPRILVVDDERSMREFLEIMLQKEGYQVSCAENGKAALELFREDRVDLIITDIRMTPVDGLEVLRQAKAIEPRTVVIIISAYASTETAVAAMKEGSLRLPSQTVQNRGDEGRH